MHADDGSRLHGVSTLHLLEVDHRDTGMGVAFRACGDASVATYAPTGINVEALLDRPILPSIRYL